MEANITTQPLSADEDFDTPAKQDKLPGMEDAAIDEIEEAATVYRALIDKRVAALRKEITAGDALTALMEKHGKLAYRRELADGRMLEITTYDKKKKTRVKLKDPDEETT